MVKKIKDQTKFICPTINKEREEVQFAIVKIYLKVFKKVPEDQIDRIFREEKNYVLTIFCSENVRRKKI